MAVEIVTIVNSSGKIISNGKHLVNAFKEAKAAYEEKKAAVKAERAIRRSQTYDVPATPRYEPDLNHDYQYGRGDYDRRYSHDDGVSQTSSRKSHRSKHSRTSRHRSASQSRPALTAGNLRTHSEVSSVTPSRPPVAYHSPYAETAPRDMVLSRPTLAHAPTMPCPPTQVTEHTAMENALMQRSRSDPALQETGKKKKEIDMNLAYGSIPPDLADRVDLDPAYQAVEKEHTARSLMGKIEDLLVEAQCLHHTATHIIEHLQGKPEAAAAVALTLAELSTLLGKMSPAFLGVIKGGSPAIFALLASPQFLIAAGLTVGVTVVMFGGWKIIKRIKEAKEAEAAARMPPMAFEAHPDQPAQQPAQPPYPESEASEGFDEALIVEEELSTIETWRRGIAPFGEDESADLELISPEADRTIRSQYGGDDARTERSVRTHKTSKSHKSHKSHRSRAHDDSDIPERKSSRRSPDEGNEEASESGSHHSHRSHRSHHSHRSESHRSEKTERSSKSKRSSRTERLAIEDGSRDKTNTIETVLRPKKDNMLKSLFKKKKKEEEDQGRSSSLLRV
ncbi:hypothetical protein E0Z10_g171 [Xylaria hypoxylon]|uniref:Uncharacterized protein n=1 Tax=Xylaria hypoxylon TaxID=37992 RepID=A0A4Z0ZI41_9PEZI|nr:hypothetical protein E0Z10_g171 [Xylaria hypoxylon]